MDFPFFFFPEDTVLAFPTEVYIFSFPIAVSPYDVSSIQLSTLALSK